MKFLLIIIFSVGGGTPQEKVLSEFDTIDQCRYVASFVGMALKQQNEFNVDVLCKPKEGFTQGVSL